MNGERQGLSGKAQNDQIPDSFERDDNSNIQFFEGGEKEIDSQFKNVSRTVSVVSESNNHPQQIQEAHYENSRQSVRSSQYKQKGNINFQPPKKLISVGPDVIRTTTREFKSSNIRMRYIDKKAKLNVQNKKLSLYQVNDHFPGTFFYLKSDEFNISEKDGVIGDDQKLEFESQGEDFMN